MRDLTIWFVVPAVHPLGTTYKSNVLALALLFIKNIAVTVVLPLDVYTVVALVPSV